MKVKASANPQNRREKPGPQDSIPAAKNARDESRSSNAKKKWNIEPQKHTLRIASLTFSHVAMLHPFSSDQGNPFYLVDSATRAPVDIQQSHRRGYIRRSKRQRANAIYTLSNGVSTCRWYLARLLLVLHDFDLLLVRDKLVVAFRREVHG